MVPVTIIRYGINPSVVHQTNGAEVDVEPRYEGGEAGRIRPLDVLLLCFQHIPPALIILRIGFILPPKLLHTSSYLLR